MPGLSQDIRGGFVDPSALFIVSSQTTPRHEGAVQRRSGYNASTKDPDTGLHRCPNDGFNVVPLEVTLAARYHEMRSEQANST